MTFSSRRINGLQRDKKIRFLGTGKKDVKTLLLNNAADFMKHGFCIGAICYFDRKTDNGKSRYTVKLYKLASPLDAFRIYAHFKPMEKDLPPNIEFQAYLLDRRIVFWKNHYYVEIDSEQEYRHTAEELRLLGKAISSRIPSDYSVDLEIDIMKKMSITYEGKYIQFVKLSPAASDYYGKPRFLRNSTPMSFFPEMYYATAITEFNDYTNPDFFLLIKRTGATQAQTVFYQYKNHLKENGQLNAWQFSADVDYIFGNDPMLGRISFLFRYKDFLGGFFYPAQYAKHINFKNVIDTFNKSYLSIAFNQLILTHPTLKTQKQTILPPAEKTPTAK